MHGISAQWIVPLVCFSSMKIRHVNSYFNECIQGNYYLTQLPLIVSHIIKRRVVKVQSLMFSCYWDLLRCTRAHQETLLSRISECMYQGNYYLTQLPLIVLKLRRVVKVQSLMLSCYWDLLRCTRAQRKTLIISWKSEGHCYYSKIFCWEPEGRYHHRLCTCNSTLLVLKWNIVEISIVPFWLSIDNI